MEPLKTLQTETGEQPRVSVIWLTSLPVAWEPE